MKWQEKRDFPENIETLERDACPKGHKNMQKNVKNLHIPKKSSTFAR